jgi:peptidoglycan/xylan/chitin deacetylase (PgdA/CDA1 family)
MVSFPRKAALVLAASAFASSTAAGPAAAPAPDAPKPRQIVIISFDGASDHAQWQRSRRLAAITGARFTYFLSCVFLVPPDRRATYKAPGKGAGKSNVGFAHSRDDVAGRLNQIWLARAEGHDIGSHGCGHFDGANWTGSQWDEEFASFRRIVRDAWSDNGLKGEPDGWRHFADEEIVGFRAPYLSASKGLYEALPRDGFAYDASAVSRGPAAPKEDGGVMRFALPQIPEGPSKRLVIGMDYNLFVRHSGGFERADRDGVFEQRTLDAFNAAFAREYDGGRTPLEFGFHFTLMNGGAYWRALERFAHDVCLRADVACISYADYLREPARNAAEAPSATPLPG